MTAPAIETHTPDAPKFPDVKVELVGQDGNAVSIIGRVQQAMRRAGKSSEDIKAFVSEATDGDYNHLLQTTMCTVNTLSFEDESDDLSEDDEELYEDSDWDDD